MNKGDKVILKTGKVYTVGKQIGKGTFGQVNLAYHSADDNKTKKLYIIKEVEDRTDGEHECSMLYQIKRSCDPYLVCVCDCGTYKGKFYIVFEYIPDTIDFFDIMWNKKYYLTILQYYEIATILLKGLRTMHKSGIIHRDIKPENILYERYKGSARYIDFGLSCSALPTTRKDIACLNKICGSLDYVDPYILFMARSGHWRDKPAMEKVEILKNGDIYSLGCVLYEMFLSNRIDALYNYTQPRYLMRYSGRQVNEKISLIQSILITEKQVDRFLFRLLRPMLLSFQMKPSLTSLIDTFEGNKDQLESILLRQETNANIFETEEIYPEVRSQLSRSSSDYVCVTERKYS